MPRSSAKATGTVHLDLLTRLGQAFAYADLEIVRVPFDDLTVSVVGPRTLYRMKRATVRLKDKADAYSTLLPQMMSEVKSESEVIARLPR